MMAEPGVSDEPLSVGMLGYRFMGRAHANALARLPMFFPDSPTVERDVLIGRNEAALESAAERLGFAETATDWRAVLDGVDILYNLAPNDRHVEPSVAALEAGTHVLCEKPLAHTLEGARRMRDAANESDATAGVAFNYRFVPAIRYAKRLIADGEVGEVYHVRGRYFQDWLADPEAPWSWRNDASVAGSGALGDLGAHTLDLCRFLVGDVAGDVTDVSGRLRTFVEERPLPDEDETRPVTVDDAFTARAAFENGALATLEASRVAAGHKNDHTIVVNGSEGSLRFSLERLNELEVLRGYNRGYETVLVTDQHDPYIDRWWPPGHVIGWEHTFVHENYEFLRSAVGEGPHAPDFEAGYRVQELMAAIERSDERGERVEV
jgi:predicted dehydrogenase